MGALRPCPGTHTSQLEQPGSRVGSDQSMPLQQAMEGDLLSPTMIRPEGRQVNGRLLSTLNSGQRAEHLQTGLTRQKRKGGGGEVAGSPDRPTQSTIKQTWDKLGRESDKQGGTQKLRKKENNSRAGEQKDKYSEAKHIHTTHRVRD